MAEDIKRLDKILLSIFYLGWTLLWISLFFKHTKALWWIGNFLLLFTIGIYMYYKEIFLNLLSKLKSLLIFLTLLILFLLFSIFFSFNKWVSFEAFIVNYFSNIILFLSIIFLINFYKNNNIILTLLIFTAIVFLFFVGYLLLYFLNLCNLTFTCYITSVNDEIFKNSLLQKPLTILPSSFLLCFCLFLIGFIAEKKRYRYLFLIMFILTSTILFWFNRRAVLLGIFLSLILLFFKISVRSTKKIIFIIIISFLVIGFLIITNPLIKNTFLGRDNLKLLVSKNYEKLPESGSLGKRLYVWPIYLKHLIKNPLKGTGIGRKVQKIEILKYNLDPIKIGNPHNTFLNIWMQTGIQTLIVFLLFYFWTFKKTWDLLNSKKYPYDRYGIGLSIFFIACFILMNFFGIEEGTRFTPFWIASGLTWGLWTKLNLSK